VLCLLGAIGVEPPRLIETRGEAKRVANEAFAG